MRIVFRIMRCVLFLADISLAALSVTCAAMAQERTVTIDVDLSVPAGISRFDTGVTHEHYSLDTGGDPAAIARAKRLLVSCCRYQCQAIMGWGADNPEPSPGRFNWGSLDARISLIRSMRGATPVITLCAAPDWMKGGQAGQTDWTRIETAPLPEHFDDFANLAAATARRYPDVTRFQVWNEFKGFWNAKANNWDYAGYTTLYNKVYDALKAINPRIQVGGPYLVVEADGSDSTQWWGQKPITARNNVVLDYWLAHKHGADFIVLDWGLKEFHNPNELAAAQAMALTPLIGSICDQIRAKTKLPIWFAEFYAWTDKSVDRQLLAANMASLLHFLVEHGATAALVWGPQDNTPPDWKHALFTDTRHPGGGQPYPLYDVLKTFHENFGPRTRFYRATSSSPDVEALASARKVLLINKSGGEITVLVNGRAHAMRGYQIVLIDAPARHAPQ